MIGELIQIVASDPENAPDRIKRAVASAGQTAGYALGLTDDEMRTLGTSGIPKPLLAVVCLTVGAASAMRYAPDRWIQAVRRFGR